MRGAAGDGAGGDGGAANEGEFAGAAAGWSPGVGLLAAVPSCPSALVGIT